MKQESKDLLVTVIKDYMSYAQDDLNEAIGLEDYDTARDRAEDIMHYSNCLDQFGLVEDITKMTNDEFSTYFSAFESWQMVKDWIAEPDEWEDDIRHIAEQHGLEDCVDDVIAIVKD